VHPLQLPTRQEDLADLRAKHPTVIERTKYLERLAGDTEKHAEELKTLQSVYAEIAAETGIVSSHYASLQQRLEYIEKQLGGSAERHSEDMPSLHHPSLPACLAQLEKKLGDSADRHTRELQALKGALEEHMQGLGDICYKHAMLEERIKYWERVASDSHRHLERIGDHHENRVVELGTLKEQAATRIQAQHGGAAAQRQVRGQQAKGQAAPARAMTREEEAATRIQALHRGAAVRRHLRSQRSEERAASARAEVHEAAEQAAGEWPCTILDGRTFERSRGKYAVDKESGLTVLEEGKESPKLTCGASRIQDMDIYTVEDDGQERFPDELLRVINREEMDLLLMMVYSDGRKRRRLFHKFYMLVGSREARENLLGRLRVLRVEAQEATTERR